MIFFFLFRFSFASLVWFIWLFLKCLWNLSAVIEPSWSDYRTFGSGCWSSDLPRFSLWCLLYWNMKTTSQILFVWCFMLRLEFDLSDVSGTVILSRRRVLSYNLFIILCVVLCVCVPCCAVTVYSMLCCVPVVFDSWRCYLPHGLQFGPAPIRGRQRAELIPTEVQFPSLCFILTPLSLFLCFLHNSS